MSIAQDTVELAKSAIELVRRDKWTCTSAASDTLYDPPAPGAFRSGCVVWLIQHFEHLGACGAAVHRLKDLYYYYEECKPVLRMFPNDRDRMIALLMNVIRNHGTFVPTDIRPIEDDAPTIPTLDFKDHDIHCLADLRMVLDAI